MLALFSSELWPSFEQNTLECPESSRVTYGDLLKSRDHTERDRITTPPTEAVTQSRLQGIFRDQTGGQRKEKKEEAVSGTKAGPPKALCLVFAGASIFN